MSGPTLADIARAQGWRDPALDRPKETGPVAGSNLPNALADFDVAFPWEAELRSVSPITEKFSHLRPYWYRAGARWVLYDCLPRTLIPDALPVAPGLLGGELVAILNGLRPSERSDYDTNDRLVLVSDVQHEFYRRYQVYARPFWVLQGEKGGHQVNFSPWQQNVLLAKRMEPKPPPIGSLPACPFDNRTVAQLNHLNRLHGFEDRLDRLQASSSRAAADIEMQRIEREIREAEAAFVVEQMTPLVELTSSLAHGANSRSEHEDQLVVVESGMASRAHDAWQQYLETGDYILRDVTGHTKGR